jgi:hypothetical protein
VAPAANSDKATGSSVLSLRINPEPNRRLQVSAFRGALSKLQDRCQTAPAGDGTVDYSAMLLDVASVVGLTSKIAPAKRRVSPPKSDVNRVLLIRRI